MAHSQKRLIPTLMLALVITWVWTASPAGVVPFKETTTLTMAEELRGSEALLALRRYREALMRVAAAGGWPLVPPAPTLHPGDESPVVEPLRARLAAEALARGDAVGETPIIERSRYDVTLQTRVRQFQYLHGLEVDGVVGPKTTAALNQDVQAQLVRLDRAIDALATGGDPFLVHLPKRAVGESEPPALTAAMDDTFIEVNVPAFIATLFRSGGAVFSTPVVVGRPTRPTPRFTASMTHLIVNPDWTVPPTILRQDILPALKQDPDYLAAHGLILLDRDGRRVDPTTVDFRQYSAATFPFIVRQPPCPNHTLGVVKFMFPNRYSVYMHDTNHPELFRRAVRAYSSGCIRVARPRALAEALIADAVPAPAAALDAWISEGRTRRVDLPTGVPVRIVYRTVVVDQAGAVRLLPDIYGVDAEDYRIVDRRTPELPRALGHCPLPVSGWDVE